MFVQTDIYPDTNSGTSLLKIPVGTGLDTEFRSLNPSDGALALDGGSGIIYYGLNEIWVPMIGNANPYAYTYLYTEFPYTIPQYNYFTNPNIVGLVEFETTSIENTSSGSFVHENITTNGSNITGISVPIAGDYEIGFTVTGATNTGESADMDFCIGLNGISVTPSGSSGITSTVDTDGNPLATGNGRAFKTLNFNTDNLLYGSVILSLVPSDVVRILNLTISTFYLRAQSNTFINNVCATLKIKLLHAA